MEKIKVIDMCVDDFGQFGVHAISVVEKPAIQVDFVALNEDKRFIKLESDEKRMLYGALLIPDQLIYRVDEETNEEWQQRTGYVPEGLITEEIQMDLQKLGWAVAPEGDWQKFR